MKIRPIDGISSAIQITTEIEGPHAVIFSGTHGDEPSGVHAVHKLLFDFICQNKVLQRGKLTLVIANEEALRQDVRYISNNLNRIFLDTLADVSTYELRRAKELMPILKEADYFLDLHSIRSETEPYAVIEEPNIAFAKKLGIKHIAYDWAKCCQGSAEGDTDNYAIKYGATSVTFEAGSHYEYSSIFHATNTALRFLEVLEMLPQNTPINSEESFVYRLTKVKIKESEDFQYSKLYRNFQRISEGEIIAFENGNEIKADKNCFITLVNYPEKTRVGDDIFFLCELI